MLRIFNKLPDKLLETQVSDLAALLGGPSLIHLPGEKEPALFVSVLQHGNEPAGFEAIRRLLKRYQPGGGGKPLPRSLSLFIGNVEAAACNMRRLPGGVDYNRIWPGSELPLTPEHAVMAEIVTAMHERGVFASIDIHNNTGQNPHYGCVNRLEGQYLDLAALFAKTIVYYLKPVGVQSMAFAELCPSVTLECGKPGDEDGVLHAFDYLDTCLNLAAVPSAHAIRSGATLLHTYAVVKIPDGLDFSFDDPAADFQLSPDLSLLNFKIAPAGTLFGKVKSGAPFPVRIENETGADVTHEHFEILGGRLRTKQDIIPSMLTRDTTVIRQDCLCYLMEQIPLV